MAHKAERARWFQSEYVLFNTATVYGRNRTHQGCFACCTAQQLPSEPLAHRAPLSCYLLYITFSTTAAAVHTKGTVQLPYLETPQCWVHAAGPPCC